MKNPLFFLLGLLFSFFSWQGTAQSYCPVVGAYTEGLNVTHVIYAGISNRHVDWSPVYNDYTNHVAYVHPGETNQLELWVQPYWGGYLYAYIDWNRNGILDDEGEVYYFGFKDTGNYGPHRKQILVPENAILGNTRMRVGINDVDAGPCDEFYYGEVEDYTVNITPVATSTFLTTWTTTTANETITIPTNPSETYSYSVSWENNGVWQNGFTGNATHTFPNPGTYTVAISGTFPAIYFNNSGDKDKIQSIEQWGTISWTSMQGTFSGCTNVTYNASDVPDLSLVSNMASMFEDASSFNADLSSWDVSNVSTMENTFFLATSFNGDISTWNVGNVTNMKGLFAGTSIFNGDISNWDVSNVATMSGMFTQASAFNQNIGGWNVSNVDDMEYMFYSATAFNQDLSSWDVSSVTQMNNMFFNTQLSTANYDALLNEWSTLTLQNGVTLDVGSVQYCDGSAARTGIIADFGWAINDGGLMVGCDPSDYFITTWKTDNPGTSNNTSIEITTAANEVYNYDVNWGDGSGWQIGITGNATHTYATAGTYTVSIHGTFPQILFETYSDREKILSIEQWGTNVWTSMKRAFFECNNLVSNASDAPNLSAVTTTESMFERAFSFNGDLSDWDVSTITNMGSMFNSAISFNSTIGSWNVSNVTNMAMMFSNATSFNQDIRSWDVSSVTQMNNMFFNTPLSTANYDALLNEWSTLTLQNGVTFDVGGVQYCNGLMARATIIADFGWTINDGGAQDGCGLSGHFITTWKTDNPGTSNATSITIPTHPDEVYTYDVDWGDGNGWETGFTADATHTYTTEGTYTVSIRGTFPRIYFNNAGDKDKILSIEEWGTIAWTSMESAFYGCANLIYNAFDAPNLSAVANTKNMFRNASSFNGNLSNWDMGSVSNN